MASDLEGGGGGGMEGSYMGGCVTGEENIFMVKRLRRIHLSDVECHEDGPQAGKPDKDLKEKVTSV